MFEGTFTDHMARTDKRVLQPIVRELRSLMSGMGANKIIETRGRHTGWIIIMPADLDNPQDPWSVSIEIDHDMQEIVIIHGRWMSEESSVDDLVTDRFGLDVDHDPVDMAIYFLQCWTQIQPA